MNLKLSNNFRDDRTRAQKVHLLQELVLVVLAWTDVPSVVLRLLGVSVWSPPSHGLRGVRSRGV